MENKDYFLFFFKENCRRGVTGKKKKILTVT